MTVSPFDVNSFAYDMALSVPSPGTSSTVPMTNVDTNIDKLYYSTISASATDDANADGRFNVGETVTLTNYLGVAQNTVVSTTKLSVMGSGKFSWTSSLAPKFGGTADVLVTTDGTKTYLVFVNGTQTSHTANNNDTSGASGPRYGELINSSSLTWEAVGYEPGKGPICYLAGTQILTDRGTVAVEELREGDMVVCRFGGLRPVRWIGRQHFAGLRAAGQEAIRFAPGAIADGVPSQALFVSPGHSMLVGETLVLAADLVNGITITREAPRKAWSYFQIDLGEHDLVLANGTWSETFADCGSFRERFDNFAEFRLRFPGHAAPEEPVLCAERPAGGAALHAALRHTAGRALDLQEPAAPGRLEGRIEGVAAPCHVTGWVMDADHRGRPVMLEVVLDGEVIGTTCACAPRREAKDQGAMEFFFEGDRSLSSHELLRLVVRRVQDGQAIAPLPSAAVGQLQGHLDLVTDGCRLEGWARDKAYPGQPVMLEVVLGEEVLGTVLACRRRPDLEKEGLGDAAFVFEAHRTLSADEIEAIHLRRINDRALLRRSDRTRVACLGARKAGVA